MLLNKKKKSFGKEIFLNLLKNNNINIKEILDFEEEDLSILIGFYSYELVNVVKNEKKLKSHISFLESLINQKEKEIQNLLDIDVFVSIYTELEEGNLLVKSFSPQLNIRYDKAVNLWKSLNEKEYE